MEFEGTRFDAGDKMGYLKAIIAYGLRHPSSGQDNWQQHLQKGCRRSMMHLEVAVAAPLEQTLTYSLPETTKEPERHGGNIIGTPGAGIAGQAKVTGYVLAMVPIVEETPYKIKAI